MGDSVISTKYGKDGAAFKAISLLELSAQSRSATNLFPPTTMGQKSEDTADEWAKYRILSILGEGSYGKVFKVHQVTCDQTDTTINGNLNARRSLGAITSVTASTKDLSRKMKSSRDLLVVKEL